MKEETNCEICNRKESGYYVKQNCGCTICDLCYLKSISTICKECNKYKCFTEQLIINDFIH